MEGKLEPLCLSLAQLILSKLGSVNLERLVGIARGMR